VENRATGVVPSGSVVIGGHDSRTVTHEGRWVIVDGEAASDAGGSTLRGERVTTAGAPGSTDGTETRTGVGGALAVE
jgi:hypothetical protein